MGEGVRSPVKVTFGEYSVDLGARVVERAGHPVPIEPQVFDVLAVLIEHRDRVVTKLELFDRVWGDRFVSPATLTSRIRDLRRALGDSGQRQAIIRTAHARGFQFVADLAFDPPPRRHGPSAARRTLDPLLGREAELDRLHGRLAEERLVTLGGPGGVGKTHLMRHAIADLDAILAELADVRDAEALRRAVLDSVGGTQRPDIDTTDALVELLDGRETILVLDNCEHVIDDVVPLVAELLHRCDELRILATSRRPLALGTETVIRLGPLDTDAAVDLLIDRAARHGVELDARHGDLAAEVCERLDCLPLALELAASKTRALPLDELGQLLDRRLTVLTSDSGDPADHHDSLDAAIRWSVELLTDAQRRLLASLSVFVGPFGLADVTAVCTPDDIADVDVVRDLMTLTDVSLVAFDATTGRYRLLESIRMYAETLGVDPDVADRLRAHVVATLESAGRLPARSFSADLATIRSIWPSVRAVAGSARREGDAATLHRIIAAAIRAAEQTFAFEVLDWIDTAIELDAKAGTPTPADTHLAAALLLTHRSEFDAAALHLPHTAGADPAMRELAHLWYRYFTGDLDGADTACAEIRRLDGGTDSYAGCVATVAGHFLDQGANRPFDPDAIATLATWAVGDDPGLAVGSDLCAVLRLDWDAEAEVAVERLTAIIDEARRSGFAFLAIGASTARSIALAVSPEAENSARVLRATLRSYAEIGSWQFALADFGATALALAHHGQQAAAAELLGARQAAGYVGDSSDDVAETAARAARDALGPQRFADCLRQGAARSPAIATRLALAALTTVIGDQAPLAT